ncbi:PKD domain-containing protein [Arthrobacter burdickii]|uniref:PKD domain-containing protein n=1 Tax=Arthrobacter burdickii TaxID=3035920 RepID=A0ABT8K614_9MICC|nr:PKD domain-containing protein [Arthrobacter burdickii]MDN4612597.1 PKD domain-containing protein [Arthrobacter burdickii]
MSEPRALHNNSSRPWLVSRMARAIATISAGVVLAASFAAVPAQAVEPAVPPATLPATVSADLLVAPQINGVVWSTAVDGNTAYAVGSFTRARPAGVPAGGAGEVVRNNAMAFNIDTGAILPWDPNLNAQARVIELTSDRKQLFVGGDFTVVSGQARSKIASFSTATGTLDPSFKSSASGSIYGIAVTTDRVYFGGSFSTAGGSTRSNVAAVARTTGALLPWAPTPNAQVQSIVAAQDNSRVVLGGRFQQLNGVQKIGIGAVDGISGASQAWSSTPIPAAKDASSSWVTQMILRNGVVYAGANGDGGHWFDGRFAADFMTGDLVWLDNCYGSTSDVSVMGDIMYFVSHAHDCSSVGSFPEENPTIWRRLMGNTIYATGTDQAPPSQNSLYSGQPTPSQVHWYPSINTGFYTNQFQGGWAMDNNGTKIVVGGEFTTVNGVAQQGLAVFGSRAVAPNKVRPEYTTAMKPTAVSLDAGSVRIAWPTTWDYDDETLTYDLLRDNSLTPIATLQQASSWWRVKTLGYLDSGRTAGATHTYRVRVKDPAGNEYIGPRSDSVTVGSAARSAYADLIARDGAVAYYPLNESAGTSFIDNIGFNDATAGTGLTRGVDGFMPSTTTTRFDGTAGAFGATRTAETAPNTFTAEAWIRTETTTGGKIIGFGNAPTGDSGSYDRHVYMSNDGRITFGVRPGSTVTIRSAGAFNDGKWHLVTASLGADGMNLYVDGVREAARSEVTAGQAYTGRWRIGGDNLGGWPNTPSSSRFTGDIDEVAIYPTALDRRVILGHFTASGRTADVPPAPTDAYGKAVDQDDPALFWRLDDSGSANAADSSSSRTEGLVSGNVTREAAGVVKGTATKAFTFDGTSGMTAANKQSENPRVYSMEAWFKTDTTRGGKIIGFGNTSAGLSGSYDRHVYMEDSGKLIFGTFTGQMNTIQTQRTYNDNAWHHVVASQSPQGMKLYVDGTLAGTNPQAGAESYTGYWRIGGDRTWGSSSAFFKGSIDEVAVYSRELSAERVKAHYDIVVPPNQLPASAFSSEVTDLNVVLDGGASTDPDGTVTQWNWSFGDGTTAEGARVQHAYTKSGSYEVSLTVTDNRGGKATTSKTISATTPNALPVADVQATQAGLSVTFDASGSKDADGSIASYSWNFGDGTTAEGPTPTHQFGRDGTYTVTLVLIDDRGGRTSLERQIQVSNSAPTATFAGTSVGLDAHFDGTGSTDVDGTIRTYAWDFGDGSTGSGAVANHRYAASGSYTVTLTVTDDRGLTGAFTSTVNATKVNQSPTPGFQVTTTDLLVQVDGSEAKDADGTITGYAWTFGDGAVASGRTAQHAYAAAGSYDVTLTVTDSDGASATVTRTVTVQVAPPASPTASFTARTDNLTATFSGAGSSSPNGAITTYAWSFGDGSTATGVSPSHAYRAAGTYDVKLTVTDVRGAQASTTQSVSVSAPLVAAFEVTTQGRLLSADATSTGGSGVGYAWDFGDGTTATGVTSSHRYTKDGAYTVLLTVTDAAGRTASTAKTVTVANSLPTSSFTPAVSGLDLTVDATASKDAESTALSYTWSFGDGTAATGRVATHTYAAAGTYTVTLVVRDEDGGEARSEQRVLVEKAVTEPRTFARDAFSRTVSSGWGSAEVGGAYSYSGTLSNFSVANGKGLLRLGSAGAGPSAYLNSVSSTDTEVRANISIDKAATGGGVHQSFLLRDVSGAGAYTAKLQFQPNGSVTAFLLRNETILVNQTVISSLSYAPGKELVVRAQVVGTSPTVIRMKVWAAGTPEPASWQLSTSDGAVDFQKAGRVGFQSYLSGSATNAPVIVRYDDLWVGEARP